MKPEELRIGNYFNLIDRSGKIHLPVDTVFEIKYFNGIDGVVACKPDENIATIKEPFEFSFRDMSPIPLTEEWLKKLNFKIKDEEYSGGYNYLAKGVLWESGKINILQQKDKFLYYITCDDSYYNYYLMELEYVHTVQNLQNLII